MSTILVTHNGLCHCDDVMSSIILCDIFDVKFEEIRRITRDRSILNNIVKNNLESTIVVYDILYGLLDHHQEDGPNDIKAEDRKLAAIGKIWRLYKDTIMSMYGIDYQSWQDIDQGFIKPIDITDNTGILNPFNYIVNTFRDNLLRVAYGDNKLDSVFVACCYEFDKYWHGLIESEIIKTQDRIEFSKLPRVEVNGKIFTYSDKEYHVGKSCSFADGSLVVLPNGHCKFFFFNGNYCKMKGIRNGEKEGVVFTHKEGFCGEVEYFDKLKEVI